MSTPTSAKPIDMEAMGMKSNELTPTEAARVYVYDEKCWVDGCSQGNRSSRIGYNIREGSNPMANAALPTIAEASALSTPPLAKPGDIVEFIDEGDVYIGIVVDLVPQLLGGIRVKWILAPNDRFTFRHAHPDIIFWAGASNQSLPQRLKVIGHAEE